MRIGREDKKVYKPSQLLDLVPVYFLPTGKNPLELSRLRIKNQLTIKELAKKTKHSPSYLREQLRKFEIDEGRDSPCLSPFGWEWKDHKLIENAKEQRVICEILKLRREGGGYKAITSHLNEKKIPAKAGGLWWPSSVRYVIKRAQKNKEKNPCPSKKS